MLLFKISKYKLLYWSPIFSIENLFFKTSNLSFILLVLRLSKHQLIPDLKSYIF